MAVKLRLTRVGKTKQPQYRIVAADSRSPRDGRFIEILGHYNPRTEPSTLTVDNDKAVKWLQRGRPADRSRAQAARDLGRARRVHGAGQGAAHVERILTCDDSDTGESADDDVDDGTSTATAPHRASAVLTHIVTSIVDDPDAVSVDAVRRAAAGSASTSASAPATSAG